MSTSPGGPGPPPNDSDRLTRIEENAGFAEHAVEQLAAEVRLLNGRVRELAQRLASIEANLGRAAERVEKVAEGSPPETDGA